MSDNKTVQQNVALTPEIVKTKLQVALNKSEVGIQMLNDTEARLVYNEDHVKEIADFLTKTRKAITVLDTSHAEIKKPVLQQYQMIDEGRRILKSEIDAVYSKAHKKYTAIVQEIEKRRATKEAEDRRVANIKEGIQKNVIIFSEKIAACKTSAEIVTIESLINLEKTRTNKYEEFITQAVEAFNNLGKLVSAQKIKVKQLETLQTKISKIKDENLKMELQEQIEQKQESINEGAINIQEHSINQATVSSETEVAEEVLPDVKARRSVWAWEVTDIKELQKKMPHLVKLVPDEEKINDLLKTKKADKSLDGKEEQTINGLKFFLRKLY